MDSTNKKNSGRRNILFICVETLEEFPYYLKQIQNRTSKKKAKTKPLYDVRIQNHLYYNDPSDFDSWDTSEDHKRQLRAAAEEELPKVEQMWNSLLGDVAKLQPKSFSFDGDFRGIHYGPLAKLLTQSPQLESLVLGGDSYIFHGTRGGRNLDALVTSLSSLSSLKHIRAGPFLRDSLDFTPDVFKILRGFLLRIPTLERLDLTYRIEDARDNIILKELIQSSCLKRLCIDGIMGGNADAYLDWVSSLKSTPGCSLRYLSLPEEEGQLGEIAAFLKVNQTLEELVLPMRKVNQARDLLGPLQTTNRTLRALTITASSLGDEQPDFDGEAIEMLKANPVLQIWNVIYGYPRSPWKKPLEVRQYLLLNKAGRGKALRGEMTTRGDWVDALVTCVRDTNGLYFFLRQNPSLLDTHACAILENQADKKPKAKTSKKRKRGPSCIRTTKED